MGLFSSLRSAFSARRGQSTESDVRPDPAATSRATGGSADPEAADANSTTGSTPNEEFVGRVAGSDDVGFVGETGAEARAQAEREVPPS